MSVTYECSEGSSFCLNAVLTNQDGNPLDPIDSIYWWVGKPKSDEVIVAKTAVASISATPKIVVPIEANICTNERNKDEKRFLVIEAKSGVHTRTEEFEWTVKNLGLTPYPS